MWALKAPQHVADSVRVSLEKLQSQCTLPLDSVLGMARQDRVEVSNLNSRQQIVVDTALKRLGEPANSMREVIIDVAKSAERGPACFDACPCIVPNSQPYRLQSGSLLSIEDVLALQGITKDAFPSLPAWLADPTSSRMLRDMAGNAFTTSVCAAVLMSVLASI